MLPSWSVFLAAAPLLGGPSEARAQFAADFEVPVPDGAHFYSQTDGFSGVTGTGYAVSNVDGVPFYSFFQSVGGVPAVGYPVSHRFMWDGFVVQAFQKVAFQWRPDLGTVVYVNVLDHALCRQRRLAVILCLSLSGLFGNTGLGWWRAEPGPVSARPVAPQRPAVAPSVNSVRMMLVPNVGQTDPSVRFLGVGPAGSLFVTDTELILSLPPSRASAVAAGKPDRLGVPPVILIRFAESAASAQPVGSDRSTGAASFLLGSDRAKLRTDLPMFGSVAYPQLFPGVDVSVESAGPSMKTRYTVAPGADPRSIRYWFEPLGYNDGFVQSIAAWQTVEGHRVPVDVDFVIDTSGAQGFLFGSFDASWPLIVQPSLSWSTYLGGANAEISITIAVDPQGDVYVAGGTTSTNFPLAGLPLQSGNRGGGDIFVTRMSSAGGSLVYSTFLGGSDFDTGDDIVLDNYGYAYVTGATFSYDFPIVGSAFQWYVRGRGDAFVAKLNPAGSGYAYSTFLGGSANDHGRGIVVDSQGSAFVTGYTDSSGFPTAGNPFQRFWGGGNDAFVAAINVSGSGLLFGTYLGGSADDFGHSVALDASGRLFVTGTTLSKNLPTLAAIQGQSRGGEDAFVAALDIANGQVLYSSYLGGSDDDFGYGVAADPNGNAYLSGSTYSRDFPVVQPAQGTNAGTNDAFVAKVAIVPSPTPVPERNITVSTVLLDYPIS